LERLKGLVNLDNIFLSKVLNISIDVLDDGGGVNGGIVNSDDSVIAALSEDFGWANTVVQTLFVAFFVATKEVSFVIDGFLEVGDQLGLSNIVSFLSLLKVAHEFIVHFGISFVESSNGGFEAVGKFLSLSWGSFHVVVLASSFGDALQIFWSNLHLS